MLGFILVFLTGLMLAVVWTRDFVTEQWGLRYWLPLLLGIPLFIAGRSMIAWNLYPSTFSIYSWEAASIVALLGFISWWGGGPLLRGVGGAASNLGRVIILVGVPALALWWFLTFYQESPAPIQKQLDDIFSLVVIIGIFLLIGRYKFKTKKSGGGGGGGGGGHH